MRKPFKEQRDGYILYRIMHSFHYDRVKKARNNTGKCVFALEKENTLTIRYFDYGWQGNIDRKFSSHYVDYILSFKNGKFNLYERLVNYGQKHIRNISTNPGKVIGHKQSKATRKKIFQIRLNRVIRGFVRKHGFKIKIRNNSSVTNNLYRIIYPALKYVSDETLDKSEILSTTYSRQLRLPTFKEAFAKIFGTNGKKTYKLVCEQISKEKNLGVLSLGPIYRNLLPVDHIQKLLCSKDIKDISRFHNFYIRNRNRDITLSLYKNFLSGYSKDARLALALSTDTPFMIIDTFRMLAQFPDVEYDKSLKTFNEIHDNLVDIIGKKKAERNRFDLKIKQKYLDLHNNEVDNLKIVLPKTSTDLHIWGQKLHNCLSSYSYNFKHQAPNSAILGVEKGGKLTYALEILGKNINQFHAACNQPPDKDDERKIRDYLEKKEIVKKPVLPVKDNLYTFDDNWIAEPQINNIYSEYEIGPVILDNRRVMLTGDNF